MELLAILALVAPLLWGAVCAAFPFAIVYAVAGGKLPRPPVLFCAWAAGLLVAEFELVRIALGTDYKGLCLATTSIVEKVPRYRPCSISEWRSEQVFPRFFGSLVWYWRISSGLVQTAVCVLLARSWPDRSIGISLAAK